MDTFTLVMSIIAIYLTGFFVTGRIAYIKMSEVRESYDDIKFVRPPDTDDLVFIAALWPFALPFFLIKLVWDHTVTRPTKFDKEVEAHNEQVETQRKLMELSDKAEAELGLSEVSSNLLRNSLSETRSKSSRKIIDYNDPW